MNDVKEGDAQGKEVNEAQGARYCSAGVEKARRKRRDGGVHLCNYMIYLLKNFHGRTSFL